MLESTFHILPTRSISTIEKLNTLQALKALISKDTWSEMVAQTGLLMKQVM
jgi:hypothetical protein